MEEKKKNSEDHSRGEEKGETEMYPGGYIIISFALM